MCLPIPAHLLALLVVTVLPVLAAPLDAVDPFIGTGKAGKCYLGAQAPFGMISWSPNTTFSDYKSVESTPGYNYKRNSIFGFTVTHISGIGCTGAQDLPIMPVRGPLERSPVGDRSAYASRFSHAHETAHPGYYRVRLDDAQTDVEITVTERAGLGRFTFAPGSVRSILFRPTETVNGITAAALSVDPAARSLSGFLVSGGFCSGDPKQADYHLYFVAEFDQPVDAHGFWHGLERTVNPSVLDAVGVDVAGFVTFGGNPDAPVQIRIGLSYVSKENALANLHAEIPGWDFSATFAGTHAAWNALLGKLEVNEPTTTHRQLATVLYHNLLQPSLFDDVDGEYVGFDDQVHRIAPGHHKYVNFSNWDTYRTPAQLQALLVPDRASVMAASMLLDVQQGAPAGFPVWGFYNNETFIMNGYSGAPWIANAFAFGARSYDRVVMKAALLWAADNKYERGDTYRKQGYVTVIDSPWDYSVSRTLEYAIDDFSLSQMCRTLGDTASADRLQVRSQNTFNLLDPAIHYLHARNADGTWAAGFSATTEAGFNEGNSAQYTWSIPHNVDGLIAGLGGAGATEVRLDSFFSKILFGWFPTEPYFWPANEPCFGEPYVYCWLGKPWKTQDVLRRLCAQFDDTPDGLPGDDDVSAMSAYYLWAALGLYPAIPGTWGFVVAAPSVSQAILRLDDGRSITITTQGKGDGGGYIHKVMLNGRPWTASWIPLENLLAARENTLAIQLGSAPDPTWGHCPEGPPAFVRTGRHTSALMRTRFPAMTTTTSWASAPSSSNGTGNRTNPHSG